MDRHEKYWMDKKTLLYHIENLIKYDVGEKVFSFGSWGSKFVPRTEIIKGIHINGSYSNDTPSPYNIEYELEGKNDERISQENIRKYDEKIAKIVKDYHTFFDALKKGEGT